MIQRLARLLVVLLAIATLALVGVWVLTNTDFGRARVRSYALGLLSRTTHGIVRMGPVTGNLLTGATVHDISITDSAGRPFLKADSLSGRYGILNFLSKKIVISDLVLYRPDIVVEKLPNAKDWNYRILWPASKPNPADTVPGFGSWIRFDNARRAGQRPVNRGVLRQRGSARLPPGSGQPGHRGRCIHQQRQQGPDRRVEAAGGLLGRRGLRIRALALGVARIKANPGRGFGRARQR